MCRKIPSSCSRLIEIKLGRKSWSLTAFAGYVVEFFVVLNRPSTLTDVPFRSASPAIPHLLAFNRKRKKTTVRDIQRSEFNRHVTTSSIISFSLTICQRFILTVWCGIHLIKMSDCSFPAWKQLCGQFLETIDSAIYCKWAPFCLVNFVGTPYGIFAIEIHNPYTGTRSLRCRIGKCPMVHKLWCKYSYLLQSTVHLTFTMPALYRNQSAKTNA